MKSDRDSWVFRTPLSSCKPFVGRHTLLVFCGVSLLLDPHFAGTAMAKLQLSSDATAPERVASQSESEYVEKIAGDDSAAAVDSPADESGTEADAQQKEIIDQINAIRRQMGGGVAEQLEGLMGKPQHSREQLQREFDRKLNELVGTPRPAQRARPFGSPGIEPSDPSSESNRVRNRTGQALRNAARELDSVAADLEDAGLYPVADRIRATASNLRSWARTRAQSPGAGALPANGSLTRGASNLGRSEPGVKSSGLPARALDPKIPTPQSR